MSFRHEKKKKKLVSFSFRLNLLKNSETPCIVWGGAGLLYKEKSVESILSQFQTELICWLGAFWFGFSTGCCEKRSSWCPAGTAAAAEALPRVPSSLLGPRHHLLSSHWAPASHQLPCSSSSAWRDGRARGELHCGSGSKIGANAMFGQQETEIPKKKRSKALLPHFGKSVCPARYMELFGCKLSPAWAEILALTRF